MDNNYQLQYLPLFYDDLLEKASYIRDDLSNPKAANDLQQKQRSLSHLSKR